MQKFKDKVTFHWDLPVRLFCNEKKKKKKRIENPINLTQITYLYKFHLFKFEIDF